MSNSTATATKARMSHSNPCELRGDSLQCHVVTFHVCLIIWCFSPDGARAEAPGGRHRQGWHQRRLRHHPGAEGSQHQDAVVSGKKTKTDEPVHAHEASQRHIKRKHKTDHPGVLFHDSGRGAAADPVLSWEIRSETDGDQTHAVHFQREPRRHGHLHSAGCRQETVSEALRHRQVHKVLPSARNSQRHIFTPLFLPFIIGSLSHLLSGHK